MLKLDVNAHGNTQASTLRCTTAQMGEQRNSSSHNIAFVPSATLNGMANSSK